MQIFLFIILIVFLAVLFFILVRGKKTDSRPADKPSGDDANTRKRLQEAKAKVLTAEAYSNYYNKIFKNIAEPLQWLLGIAAADNPNPSWLQDTIDKIKNALGENFQTPEPAIPPVSSEFLDNAMRKSPENQERLIEDLAIEADVISFRYRKIINGLGKIMPRLASLSASGELGKKELAQIARETMQLLRDNQIYPMDDKTPPIKNNPALPIWFAKTNAGALKYPALFVKHDGEYELLGSYRGSI